MLQIVHQPENQMMTLSLSGRLDRAGADCLASAIKAQVHEGWRQLILDLSAVTFLSSAGIRSLMIAMKLLNEVKGSITVRSASEPVLNLLEIAGLYELLASPADSKRTKTPGSQTIEIDQAVLYLDQMDENSTLTGCRLGSSWFDLSALAQDEIDPIPFPPTSCSIGMGVFGDHLIDCREMTGPFMATGGTAICLPAGTESPDYIEYAEAFIPKLFPVNALTVQGNFTYQASLELTPSTQLSFDRLAEKLLDICEAPLIWVTLIAEVNQLSGTRQTLSSDLKSIQQSPVTVQSGVALINGLIGTETPPELAEWLDTTASLSTALQAAVFAYHPLPHGLPKLQTMVNSLFDHPLLDLIHTSSSQLNSIMLQNGCLWMGAVDSIK